MEQTLTPQDMALFKHALSGNRLIMNILKFVFIFSAGVWFIFLIVLLQQHIADGNSITNDVMLLFIFALFTVIFVVCVHFITKRQNKIYQALENGDYHIIFTKIQQKSTRYQGSGRSKLRIDFYTACSVRGEISPISSKQYHKAHPGDPLKVVQLPQFSITYGIVEI